MKYILIIDYNISNDCARTLSDPVRFLWKRSHRPSFIDCTLLATLTTYTSYSVRPPKPSYLLSGKKDEHLPIRTIPSSAAVCKYEEREGSSSSPERPTAVHRIVFRCYLSSRSGITLPRWYTMTFISGFARLGPWSFLSRRRESFVNDPFVARATCTCIQSDSREINVQRRHFLKECTFAL